MIPMPKLVDDRVLRQLTDVERVTCHCIADARQPENPLVYVSDEFTLHTGYGRSEALGRNCRFLQGDDTDPETVNYIRACLNTHQPCNTYILNYHRDGTAFWNHLRIRPVFDDVNPAIITHYIATQVPVDQADVISVMDDMPTVS